jgi:hypothetical protein
LNLTTLTVRLHGEDLIPFEDDLQFLDLIVNPGY